MLGGGWRPLRLLSPGSFWLHGAGEPWTLLQTLEMHGAEFIAAPISAGSLTHIR
jgi:hypothetical protein